MQRAVSSGVGRLGMTGAMAVPSPDLRRSARPWILAPDAVEAAPSLAAANRIVAGRYDVFALHDVELGSPPRWNRDPKTGTEAPLGYGLLLDYRNPRLVGDIKYLWEPNRHLHLVTLAQACDLSGDARYAETIARHLDSWVAACPCAKGPNWSSALELGIRLINWAVAERKALLFLRRLKSAAAGTVRIGN